MKQFFLDLLGMDLAVFASLGFYAALGVALMALIGTTKRDVNSPHTPFSFSWKFFASDNSKRFAAGVIMIFISLRFAPEIFGITITPFWAFGIGISSDTLAVFIKNKTSILDVKSKS